MKQLYFECSSGISGDMAVAALLDAGASEEKLKAALSTVNLKGYRIQISKVKKNGIECTDFNVILDSRDSGLDHDMEYLYGHLHNSAEHHHEEHQHDEHHHEHEHHHHEHEEHHHHTSLSKINEIIEDSGIPQNAKVLAKKIFNIIASAEAKAHGTSPELVHFHETGGIDSIIDIISFAVCMDDLKADRVYIQSISEGFGTVRCMHGILPVPVPATTYIAEEYSLPLSIINVTGELVTPTGAAIAAAIRTDSKLPETFIIRKTGFGAGKRNHSIPSILRVMIIETSSDDDSVCKLETDIDDSTPETIGFVMDELLKNKAKEVHCIPCFMKKNRPGYTLEVICSISDRPLMEKLIFNHTSTTGIRRQILKRTVLEREILTVNTAFGSVKVKKINAPDGMRLVPEYEDVAETARKNGLSFYDTYSRIASEAEKNLTDTGTAPDC